MLPVKEILRYSQFIFVLGLVVLIFLFFRQYNTAKELEQKLADVVFINEQNIKALEDNEIQLRLTEEQLEIVDKTLFDAKMKIDSLYNIKSQVVTNTEIVYLEKNIKVQNTLSFDTLKNAYGLTFRVNDSFKNINGTSFFKVQDKHNILEISSDTTLIYENSFKFALVLSEYQDAESRMSKVKITPFYLTQNNSLGDKISEDILSISYRNVELLDKPYQFNQNTSPILDSNLKMKSGFGISINPLAFGIYPRQSGGYNIGWTPNIGLGYYITFEK